MLENNPELQSAQKLEESSNSRRRAREKRVQKIIKYLGLSGSSIGISGTVGLLVAGNPKAASVAGLLTIAVMLLAITYKFASGVTNRVLDLIEEELENIEEPLARWIVNQLKVFVVGLWWKLNPKFQREYYQSLVDTFRELKIEGFKIGLPVLDLENVFVSLRVATGIPERIHGAMIPPHRDFKSQDIWDFLSQSTQKKFQAYRRLAVIGPPGSGKTTLLRHLTLTYAKKQQQKYKAPKLIPMLLYLRDIRHLIVGEQPPSLPKLIRDHIKNLPAPEPLNPPPHWIEDQLKIGKCLVMLDGLDEIADPLQREQVGQWVNRQMEVYRQTHFILTSRPHGYLSAPVEQVGTVLEVLSFNSEQVKQFIQSWYLQTEIMSRAGRDTPAVRSEAQNHADDLIERILDNRAIADMAKNPLLVTMIATVHYCGSALPGRRVELYQRICDLLLGPRQEAKKIKTSLTAEQNKSVLQVLALALMQQKTREFSPAQGQKLIQAELKKVAGSTLTPEQFLKQIKEVSGLLVERELGIYEFAHLSFQEYLAAARVKELQQDKILIENIQYTWWAETIRLYAAQSDASNLIKKAIENPTVNSLILALDCLQESLKVEPDIRQQLEEMLEAGLESSDPKIAELAAEVRLSRRLNNLLKIEENLEIDRYYITCAEYQLFVNEELHFGNRFQAGSAKRPMTGISWENALGLCAWLSSKAQSKAVGNDENLGVYYRLPTATEVQNYSAREHPQLGCWKLGGSDDREKGIRVVKTQIPSLFEFDIVTINAQGQEIQRERRHSQYFTEDLGNDVTLEVIYIPSGKFLMGSPEREGSHNEKPPNEVTIKPFFLGKYPITQAQWKAIASRTDLKVKQDLDLKPAYFKDRPDSDRRPVERVSWYDAVEFCARLSKLTGREYRLPSEAEWEYACRAGTTTPFYFGETITGELANYNASNTYADEPNGEYQNETTPVGQFPPNAFGLYDMHGNVREWCADTWHDNYDGAPTDGSAWIEKGDDNRSPLRGGSWGSSPGICRSAIRNYDLLRRDYRINDSGFRVVCSQ